MCIIGEGVTTVSSKVFEIIDVVVIDICLLAEIVEVGNEGGCVNTGSKQVNYNNYDI